MFPGGRCAHSTLPKLSILQPTERHRRFGMKLATSPTAATAAATNAVVAIWVDAGTVPGLAARRFVRSLSPLFGSVLIWAIGPDLT
jgi:hypothetical protein